MDGLRVGGGVTVFDGLVEGIDLVVAFSRLALMRSSNAPREELARSEMLGADSTPACGPIRLPMLSVPLKLPLSIRGDCGKVPREKEL